MQRILVEMKAHQEKIQKDVAHLTEPHIETKETLKKIQEELQLLELGRREFKNQTSQMETDTHSFGTQPAQVVQEEKSSLEAATVESRETPTMHTKQLLNRKRGWKQQEPKDTSVEELSLIIEVLQQTTEGGMKFDILLPYGTRPTTKTATKKSIVDRGKQ